MRVGGTKRRRATTARRGRREQKLDELLALVRGWIEEDTALKREKRINKMAKQWRKWAQE